MRDQGGREVVGREVFDAQTRTVADEGGQGVEASRGLRGRVGGARSDRHVLAQLAGVTTDGEVPLVDLGAQAAFEVHRLAAGRVLVATAVDGRDVVREVGAEHAGGVDAPVSRVAEAQTVRDRLFGEAVAVDAFSVRDPGHVVRTGGDDEGRREVGAQVGLLDEDFRVADGRVVRHVGGDVHGERVVELVVNADIEALDVRAEAVGRRDAAGAVAVRFDAVHLRRDVGEVIIDTAAHRGRVGPALGIGAGSGDHNQRGNASAEEQGRLFHCTPCANLSGRPLFGHKRANIGVA